MRLEVRASPLSTICKTSHAHVCLCCGRSDKRVLIMGSHDVYTVVRTLRSCAWSCNNATHSERMCVCDAVGKALWLQQGRLGPGLHAPPPDAVPVPQIRAQVRLARAPRSRFASLVRSLTRTTVCAVRRHRLAPFHDEPVEAVIIMHDPIDWAPEIQVAVDVLIGGTSDLAMALSLSHTLTHTLGTVCRSFGRRPAWQRTPVQHADAAVRQQRRLCLCWRLPVPTLCARYELMTV